MEAPEAWRGGPPGEGGGEGGGSMLLAVTRGGFGKQLRVDDFPTKGRGGKGVIAIKFKSEGDQLLALSQVNRIPVTVHQERGGSFDAFTYQPGCDAVGPAVHLRYTRNEERVALTGDVEAGGHYELLLM